MISAGRCPAAYLFSGFVLLTLGAAGIADAAPLKAAVPGSIAKLGAEPTENPQKLVVTTKQGKRLRVGLTGNRVTLTADKGTARAPSRKSDMLPDGVVTRDRNGSLSAWLTGPTDRYGHGVLGDAIEASGLRVERKTGKILSLSLGTDAVFEDRIVRFADLNGDSRDELLVVKSYLNRGAALTAITVGPDKLTIAGEAPAVGSANRWLNPIGAADFDGDGTVEAAVVITPHIGGFLTLYRLQGGKLVEAYREPGFSNHAIGSRELGMSAILDANGDDVPDITVPDARRRNIRIVSFAGGKFSNLDSLPISGRLATGLYALDLNGDRRRELVYGSDTGQLIVITF